MHSALVVVYIFGFPLILKEEIAVVSATLAPGMMLHPVIPVILAIMAIDLFILYMYSRRIVLA